MQTRQLLDKLTSSLSALEPTDRQLVDDLVAEDTEGMDDTMLGD